MMDEEKYLRDHHLRDFAVFVRIAIRIEVRVSRFDQTQPEHLTSRNKHASLYGTTAAESPVA